MRYLKPGDRVLRIAGERQGEVATVIDYVDLMKYVRIKFDKKEGPCDQIHDSYPDYIQILTEEP